MAERQTHAFNEAKFSGKKLIHLLNIINIKIMKLTKHLCILSRILLVCLSLWVTNLHAQVDLVTAGEHKKGTFSNPENYESHFWMNTTDRGAAGLNGAGKLTLSSLSWEFKVSHYVAAWALPGGKPGAKDASLGLEGQHKVGPHGEAVPNVLPLIKTKAVNIPTGKKATVKISGNKKHGGHWDTYGLTGRLKPVGAIMQSDYIKLKATHNKKIKKQLLSYVGVKVPTYISYNAYTRTLSFQPGTIQVLDNNGGQSEHTTSTYLDDSMLESIVQVSDLSLSEVNTNDQYMFNGGEISIYHPLWDLSVFEGSFGQYLAENTTSEGLNCSFALFDNLAIINGEPGDQEFSPFLEDFADVNLFHEGIAEDKLPQGVSFSFTTAIDLKDLTYGFSRSVINIPVTIFIAASVPNNAPDELPEVSTLAVTGISPNSAIGHGNVVNPGHSSLLAKGFCLSTHPHPDLDNQVYTLDSSIGPYEAEFSDLSPATTYYVRAYATNHEGTAYGEEISFTTEEEYGGLCQNNLALNRLTVASSEENSDRGLLASSFAVDGNPLTRWSSEWSNPQWIYVDLGSKYELCKVVLHWETAMGKNFRIEVSDDAYYWTTIHNVHGNYNQHNVFDNLNGSGRYVRIFGTQRTTQWGYSLYEFEVYGDRIDENSNQPPTIDTATFTVDPFSLENTFVGQVQAHDPDGDNLYYSFVGSTDEGFFLDAELGEIRVQNSEMITPGRIFEYVVRVVDDGPGNLSAEEMITVQVRDLEGDCIRNLALNRPAFASTEENRDHGHLRASYAVDGNSNTRWASEWWDPQWIYVDLGAIYDLCRVALKWEQAMAEDFRLEVSNDAFSWATIRTVNGNNNVNNTFDLNNVRGRYVRVFCTKRATQWGNSLFEFEVYGNQAHNRMGREESLSATDIELALFPNLAREEVNIRFNNPQEGNTSIDIINLQGQSLYTTEEKLPMGRNELRIPLNGLASGYYLIRVRNTKMDKSKPLNIIKE